MTKGKIVLVPFPFDDFSGTKVRPALCLTNEIGSYDHIIIAFISSRIPESFVVSDVHIDQQDEEFGATGLSVSSVIRLHRMVTIPKKLIKRQLGFLRTNYRAIIELHLRRIFNL